MIRYEEGNLLEADADALVNTVNEVGVMGKGIALQFREAFPESAHAYQQAAKSGSVRVGRVLVTPGLSLLGPKWIIHFPTKKHWRHPSRLEWIRAGLGDLVRVIRELGIRSIALPPLGCGNGGLAWEHVRREIEQAMGGLEVDVRVYAPSEAYHNAPKLAGVEELTPARALIAELVRRYSVLGLACSWLEVQKLAWFLDRAFDRRGLRSPMELQFSAGRYGPYSDNLRHLLDRLDGSYLHAERRLGDAKPDTIVWFDQDKAERVRAWFTSGIGAEYAEVLDETTSLIEGFESPLGLEALSTVGWLLDTGEIEATVLGIRGGIDRWPAGVTAARRKQALFDDRLLELSLQRLSTATATS